MPNEYTVLWIDDNKKRRESGRGGVGEDDRLTVVPIGPREAASELLTESTAESTLPSNPDLALVDWYLETEGYTGDGPSIEGILRDRYSTTPIYAFSGKYGDADFEKDRKRGEDRFALITSPARLNDGDLIKDIQDYQHIREQEGRGIEGIIELLDVEEYLREKIESTLPQEFAEGLPSEEEGDPDSSLRFARWLRHVFLEEPGLLWDEMWAATKVGINKDQFSKYGAELSDAKYMGVFSHRNDLWWSDLVRDKIFDKAAEEGRTVDRLWKVGPDLLGVAPEDRSVCEIDSCENSNPPETVAAGAPKEKAKYQVHYNCSNIEQSRGSTFEDFRVLEEL